eukprot:scaffold7893_cov220-Pinguiococcus_pyrenoidosus.AAC.1
MVTPARLAKSRMDKGAAADLLAPYRSASASVSVFRRVFRHPRRTLQLLGQIHELALKQLKVSIPAVELRGSLLGVLHLGGLPSRPLHALREVDLVGVVQKSVDQDASARSAHHLAFDKVGDDIEGRAKAAPQRHFTESDKGGDLDWAGLDRADATTLGSTPARLNEDLLRSARGSYHLHTTCTPTSAS